jgi:hypothetical protein
MSQFYSSDALLESIIKSQDSHLTKKAIKKLKSGEFTEKLAAYSQAKLVEFAQESGHMKLAALI